MPEITPAFTMRYENRMRAIKEAEYVRRLANKNTWWNKIMRPTPIEGRTERMTWFLETATISPEGPIGSGVKAYESMVTQTAEYPTYKHGKGLILQRDQLEDLDGTGLNQAATWSENIGNEMAYYPQRLASQLILNGANTDGSANAYDGVPFFAPPTNAHMNNPYNPTITQGVGGAGSYANWIKGAAAPTGFAAYPGASPIDSSVTVDVALNNLGKVIAYVASLKMPNGVDPRFLTPKYIVCPPAMAPRVRQLTDAKIIAQAAASGGGGADVTALISGWELGMPVVAQELAASTNYSFPMPFVATGGNVTSLDETVTGSDTSWYLFCEEMMTTQLGGLLYVSRKPFKVNYYTGENGANVDLDIMDEFKYHVRGRMSAQYGHPYTCFRIDAS
jgi:hypothetical protein